jgi:hypothetical protein
MAKKKKPTFKKTKTKRPGGEKGQPTIQPVKKDPGMISKFLNMMNPISK